MKRAALFSLFTSNAYVLDLELDGTYAPLRFAINDDLIQIARAWRQKHPSMTGGDCEEGDGRCVENVLVRAMEARFDARHVISNAAIHCKLPGHAFPDEKLTDAVGTPDESYALEQAAGFCYCAADRNFVNNRTGGVAAASIAMDAAGLALRLEPRRARAARFGMLAGQDLFGVADATACVEINQCVGCTSAMTRPSWLGRAVRNRHRHAIEQAPRRWTRAVKF